MREWTGEIGGRTCLVQRFRGPDDLLELLMLPACSRGTAGCDWFNGDIPYPPGHYGFRHHSELQNGLRTGTGVRTAGDGPTSSRTLETERLAELRRDVAGGAVIVPALTAGEPACMWTLRRRKVRSRTLGLCVDTGMLCNRTAEEYREAGQAVMDAIASLERAGYRIRLDVAYTSFMSKCGTQVVGMSMPVKGLGEPMNRRRVMWCLTEIAFMRGVCFDWQAHLPDMTDSGLGKDIEDAWDGLEGQEHEDAFFDRLSRGSAHICLSDVCHAADRSREDPAAWVAAQITG